MNIKTVLELHSLWCSGSKDGVRADLSGADLSGADLSKADLSGANLYRANLSHIEGKRILSFIANKHHAYFVDGILAIGCQSHPIEYWLLNYLTIGKSANYTDKQISDYYKFMEICRDE